MIILICILIGIALVILYYTRGLPLPVQALFFLLSWYAILGRGFAYIGIGNLFIGEIVFIFIAPYFLFSKWRYPESINFVKDSPGKAMILIMLLFAAYFLRGIIGYGQSSLRDCVILWYPVFAFFGYHIGTDAKLLGKYIKLLNFVFIVVFIYGLTYVFGEIVRNVSPVVDPEDGAFLVGHYTMNYVFVIGGIFYFLLLGKRGLKNILLIVLGISCLITISSRAGYLAFIVLTLGTGMIRKMFKYQVRAVKYLMIILCVVAFLGIVTHINTLTQVHLKMSLENIVQRIVNIFPGNYMITQDKDMQDFSEISQGTRLDRLKWTREALAIFKNNPKIWLFGEGFGYNLGAVIGFSYRVRYVHNSYVTLIVLTGLAGCGALLYLHSVFVIRARRFLKQVEPGMEDHKRNIITFCLVYYWAFMIIAFFGPLLECPFLAANLYFIMGVGIGAIKLFRQKQNTVYKLLG
ncbi:MAG: O-antigen ligase family protein [Candidatus Omnitrophota bacterium]